MLEVRRPAPGVDDAGQPGVLLVEQRERLDAGAARHVHVEYHQVQVRSLEPNDLDRLRARLGMQDLQPQGVEQIRDARPEARFDFSGGLFCRFGGSLPNDPGQNAARVDPVPMRQEHP